jgi:protein-L-isoaspartate(D-aspartate) O-methyltransferase
MTEQLRLQPHDRVLEIGTGSGYQAAVLAELVAEVYSIEIVAPLAHTAEATLQRLGYKNVHVKVGDGYKGWPEQAPFDAIIVTCAPEHVPQPLVDQMKEGGRMIIPVGNYLAQELYLLEKRNGRLREEAILPVRFVPMAGEAGKQKVNSDR